MVCGRASAPPLSCVIGRFFPFLPALPSTWGGACLIRTVLGRVILIRPFCPSLVLFSLFWSCQSLFSFPFSSPSPLCAPVNSSAPPLLPPGAVSPRPSSCCSAPSWGTYGGGSIRVFSASAFRLSAPGLCRQFAPKGVRRGVCGRAEDVRVFRTLSGRVTFLSALRVDGTLLSRGV